MSSMFPGALDTSLPIAHLAAQALGMSVCVPVFSLLPESFPVLFVCLGSQCYTLFILGLLFVFSPWEAVTGD